MRKLLLGFALLSAWMLLPQFVPPAYACSCVGRATAGEGLSRSTAVFTGQVVSADTFKARLRVDKVWKGEERSEITMLTGVQDLGNGMIQMSSCDYGYNVGQKYVVYATGKTDALTVPGCSRTAVANDDEIRQLDAVAPHKKIGDQIRACATPQPTAAATAAASAATAATSGELRVTLADSSDKPLVGVRALAEGAGKSVGALTDRSGRATFSGLPAGEYKITSNIDGYLAKQTSVRVSETACVEASLYLLRSGDSLRIR